VAPRGAPHRRALRFRKLRQALGLRVEDRSRRQRELPRVQFARIFRLEGRGPGMRQFDLQAVRQVVAAVLNFLTPEP